jgi:glutathionylspermidine synthase
MRSQPWAVGAPQFREVLQRLGFEYFKWDLNLNGRCRVLPESIVLSRQTHDFLVATAESFCALIRRFEARVRRDPGLLPALGIDRSLAPLIAAESPQEPAFSRADFFLQPDGEWVLSEFNEDVPGGFNEAAGINELLSDADLGGCRVGALRRAMVEAFAGCRNVGLVFATAFSEDLQHCALLEKWLAAAGHDTVRASPDQLRCGWTGVRLGGRRVQGMFRFYPGEWLGLPANRADWIRALPRLRLMNPPVRLLSQSKKCFGLWREGTGLDAGDQRLALRFCPHTEPFDAARIARYRNEREALVLKRAFGRMGDAVVIGALCRPIEWQAALEYAAKCAGEFAMQRRFEVLPLPFAGGTMYPTVGVYTVNGRFAGYYSRVAPRPFITHEAFYVATVIEPA